MNDTGWQRMWEIFHKAVECPTDRRAAYLQKACGDDAALRGKVERLIAAESGASSFMETPPLAGVKEQAGLDDRIIGSMIGPYRIRGVVAEGGMGAVYDATQERPFKRRVALKLIKLGMDTREVIARFESERQALAMMNHPSIAKVYDAGATDQGRPYFVMEYVPGVSITEYCDKLRLTTEARLKLFVPVCDAIQHAHQKGILHRDIKPSNVLVTDHDGKPLPKIIDFGVAKAIHHRLTERTLFTERGQLIGTPEYMSPEQAEMTGLDVDTRTDIYSLGVLLYELLVGSTPFDSKTLRSAGYAEIQRMIRDDEPSPPSTRLSKLGAKADTVAQARGIAPVALCRQLRGDLDWITMKALEKDRTRRYASALDLATDIQRHLNHEAVLASPPSAAYSVRKFVRRHRGFVTAACVVVVVLVAGILATTYEMLAAKRHERDSRAAQALAEQRANDLEVVTEFQASMLQEMDPARMGESILTGLRDGIRRALHSQGKDAATIEASLSSFTDTAALANTTDLARALMDEHVLRRAVETIEKDFADQPVVRAALRQTVADSYQTIGLYDSAMPLQIAALATRREVLGNNDPQTLTSVSNMGYLLTMKGRHKEALPYYREALATKRRVLGNDHPDTMNAISRMVGLYERMGRYEEAMVYCREALERRRRVLGDDHYSTLTSISHMGLVLESMGRLEQARPYYVESLESKRRVLGNDHPNTLNSIDNMGSLLISLERYEEALPYHHEALNRRRRAQGAEHPDTLLSMIAMGRLLELLERYEEAMP